MEEGKPKKAGRATLILSKVDFRTVKIISDKEEHYVMIHESII